MDQFVPKNSGTGLRGLGPSLITKLMIANQTCYRQILKSELVRRMSKNPRYGQRAFAKSLGISPGALSEILSGKRNLSAKKASQLADKLGYTSVERDYFLSLVLGNVSLELQKFSEKNLTHEMFQVISNPHCFNILNLIDCEGFTWDAIWIARKLGIQKAQVEQAIEQMIRVGLIEKRGPHLVASEDFVFAPEGVPSRAIKDYHKSILESAIVSLEEQDLETREISGVTFAIEPSKMSQLKKEIKDFQTHIVEKYSGGRPTRVVHLESVLFKVNQEDTDV